ncbi:unnamed protein product [Prunus armeniaca]|uniref:Reverse transcriptase zinc-binding domain-containing protein n=1 Tax=Prunus armeniaca TaxID=36596 RepID=A0A6J5XQ21_PRUAR|nr:unnamed protein product [Prunus armeniaca]
MKKKKGDLTVRSAYEVARQSLFEETGEGTSNRSLFYGVSTKAWSRLWQVCVPPKVKVLVWRTFLNILPTKERLFSKGIQGDSAVSVSCAALGRRHFITVTGVIVIHGTLLDG